MHGSSFYRRIKLRELRPLALNKRRPSGRPTGCWHSRWYVQAVILCTTRSAILPSLWCPGVRHRVDFRTYRFYFGRASITVAETKRVLSEAFLVLAAMDAAEFADTVSKGVPQAKKKAAK